MLERDGLLTLVEENTYDGVRQSASEGIRRYSLLRNLNVFNREALTKEHGIRRLHAADFGSSADVLGGYDAHYQGGTQVVVAVNTGDVFEYNTSTRAFDAKSQSLANARPDLFMFANKLLLLNGTQFRSRTSAGTWTAVSGSPPAAKFGTVHAGRALVAGVSGSEHLFYPSGVRDETDWDTSLAVIVDSAEGTSGLTNLGRLGPYMIVQTPSSTHAYQLSTDNPRDWDNFDISTQVGATVHTAWVEVERAKGNEMRSYSFFWGYGGPYMLAHTGSKPALLGLMDPIMRSVRGTEYQDFPALDVSRYGSVSAAYEEETGRVLFGVTKQGDAENNLILWVDVESAVAFADGQVEYPFWGLRDNVNLGYFPSDVLFTAQVDSTGLPSATGQRRVLAGRNGVVFELHVPGLYEDHGEPLPFEAVRAGYDGAEDGVRSFIKSMRHARVRATQIGGGELYVDLIADGGQNTGTATLDLDAGLTTWGGSTWGGGRWNAGEFRTIRGDFGVNGERFAVRLYDEGNIEGEFQIDGWEIDGYVEDRR